MGNFTDLSLQIALLSSHVFSVLIPPHEGLNSTAAKERRVKELHHPVIALPCCLHMGRISELGSQNSCRSHVANVWRRFLPLAHLPSHLKRYSSETSYPPPWEPGLSQALIMDYWNQPAAKMLCSLRLISLPWRAAIDFASDSFLLQLKGTCSQRSTVAVRSFMALCLSFAEFSYARLVANDALPGGGQ